MKGKNIINFENGSKIEIIEYMGEITYGRRREEAIQSMFKQLRRYPSLYIELTKKLPWYQRFCIDKVLKYFYIKRRK